MSKSYLEIDYIAIQVICFLEKFEYSPNSGAGSKALIKMFDGSEVTVLSAYRKIKKNVNYVDDRLLEKINSHSCIFKKLKKSTED